MESSIDIDWEQLHQVSEDDPDFELELLTMLAEDVKVHIEDLRQAISKRDASLIAHEAHYIKGASSTLGIVKVTALAKEIEQLAHAEVTTDTAPLVEQMMGEIDRLESYLTTRK